MNIESKRDERLTQAERGRTPRRACTCVVGEMCVCFYVPAVDGEFDGVAGFGAAVSSPAGSSLSLRTSM
jgi:hypothetical protein